MERLKKYKNILLFLGIFAALAVGYTMFFGDDGDGSLLVSEQPLGSPEIGRELLTTLLEIKSLSLDESLFASPAFTSLEDFSQELVSLPSGRANPFAPIGVDGQ
jgi:hypothetical protein|tara:strand:+ start:32560 stop:32871 length:312 start_codon:yes stop_codon:yes gene_type:complete